MSRTGIVNARRVNESKEFDADLLIEGGRIARIDEINAAVLYLAKADFVSGTVLAVDGGYSAGR